MAKYIKYVDGELTEINTTDTSSGAADADKIPSLGADGKLALTMMPSGIGNDVKSITASEALTASNFVNLWSDAGVLKMRKADAATGKRIDGFVLESVASGATGVCYLSGINNQLSGLTVGSTYWLSDSVPGGVTSTPIVAADGKISQKAGRALSATDLLYMKSDVIYLKTES